jgi:peptide/nickel transport system substrate-binding protein
MLSTPDSRHSDQQAWASARLAGIDREDSAVRFLPSHRPTIWARSRDTAPDVYGDYVKGHNPADYFGIYDVVREDIFWLDKT